MAPCTGDGLTQQRGRCDGGHFGWKQGRDYVETSVQISDRALGDFLDNPDPFSADEANCLRYVNILKTTFYVRSYDLAEQKTCYVKKIENEQSENRLGKE